MKLLLDTHVWVWALLEPSRLSPRVRKLIEDRKTERWLSAISVWEVALLIDAGRLAGEGSAKAWVESTARALPVRDAPVDREVAMVSRTLVLPHQDPADRFIVATASIMGLTLVTADRHLLRTGACEVLSASTRS